MRLFAPEQVSAAVRAYNAQAVVPVTPRTHAQVTALLSGLPPVAPGVVGVTEWRTDGRSPIAGPTDLYAGLACVRELSGDRF